MENLVEFAAPHRSSKPIVVAMRNSGDNLQSERARLRITESFLQAGVPVFRSMERACRAIYKATAYYDRRGEPAKPDEDMARMAAQFASAATR